MGTIDKLIEDIKVIKCKLNELIKGTPSSNSGNENWQDTLDVSSILNRDNTAKGAGKSFFFENFNAFSVNVSSNFIIKDQATLNNLVNFAATGDSEFSNPVLNTPTFQFGRDGSYIQYGNNGTNYWENLNIANTGDTTQTLRNGAISFVASTLDNDAFRRYGNDGALNSLLREIYYDGTTFKKITNGISGASFFADELTNSGTRTFSSMNTIGDNALSRLIIDAGTNIGKVIVTENADLYITKIPEDLNDAEYVVLVRDNTSGIVGYADVSGGGGLQNLQQVTTLGYTTNLELDVINSVDDLMARMYWVDDMGGGSGYLQVFRGEGDHTLVSGADIKFVDGATSFWNQINQSAPTQDNSAYLPNKSGIFALIEIDGDGVNFDILLQQALLTEDRIYNFPDASGTIPLTINGVGADSEGNIEFEVGGPISVNEFNTLYSNTPLAGQGGSGNNILFGLDAGIDATNITQSIFLGKQAGMGATNANYSVFLGISAGQDAVSAENAVFLGYNAGIEAANNIVAIGYDAGHSATNAQESIFIGGTQTGYQATNASQSVFLGSLAGSIATDATYSVFIGQNAGNGAATAAHSIFIGSYAGFNDTVDNISDGLSILIGQGTGTGGFKNSIVLSTYDGTSNTKANQFTLSDNITDVRWSGVEYTLPTIQGDANTVLTNDGTGVLSWEIGSGGDPVTFQQALINGSILTQDNTIDGDNQILTFDNVSNFIAKVSGTFKVKGVESLEVFTINSDGSYFHQTKSDGGYLATTEAHYTDGGYTYSNNVGGVNNIMYGQGSDGSYGRWGLAGSNLFNLEQCTLEGDRVLYGNNDVEEWELLNTTRWGAGYQNVRNDSLTSLIKSWTVTGSYSEYGNDGTDSWTTLVQNSNGSYDRYVRNGGNTFYSERMSSNGFYEALVNDGLLSSSVFDRNEHGATNTKVTASISGASFYVDELSQYGDRSFSSMNGDNDGTIKRFGIGNGAAITDVATYNSNFSVKSMNEIADLFYVDGQGDGASFSTVDDDGDFQQRLFISPGTVAYVAVQNADLYISKPLTEITSAHKIVVVDDTTGLAGYADIAIPDWQSVTDIGATTTNPVTINDGIGNSTYIAPDSIMFDGDDASISHSTGGSEISLGGDGSFSMFSGGIAGITLGSNEGIIFNMSNSLLINGDDGSAGAVLKSQGAGSPPIWESIPILTNGTYTPTLTNVTNITSTTAQNAQYTRVGSIVTVYGSFDVTTTLAIASQVDISLPIASSLIAVTDLNGLGQAGSAIATNAVLSGNFTNDRASINFIGLAVSGAGRIYYSFSYTVL